MITGQLSGQHPPVEALVSPDLLMAALDVDAGAFRRGKAIPELELGSWKTLTSVYAPFDHVNEEARVVIVGLTPGRQQAANALEAYQSARLAGAGDRQALEQAKVHASFSGPMRRNLVHILDCVGMARYLAIESSAELFDPACNLAHFTSALRYPVFVDGSNYSGAPDPLVNPWLRTMAETWLAEELRRMPEALVVPLGPKVAAIVRHVAQMVGLKPDRIIDGLPHPSGANAERIAFFLGRKPAEALSARTDPVRLVAARKRAEALMTALLTQS